MHNRRRSMERLHATGFGAVVVVCLAVTQVPQDAPQSPRLDPREKSFQIALRDAHNKVRAKEGKAPLAISPWLAQAAKIHAKDMAARHEMSHTGSDDSTPDQRVSRVGYKFINTGENVAAGHKTIAQVMSDWMNSEGHRANILGDFTEIGGARIVDSDGVPYWTVEFGTPVPAVDPLKAKDEFAKALNELRKGKMLSPVSVSPELQAVADSTAKDIASAEKPPGKVDYQELYQQVKDSGYNYKTINLSIASGQYAGGDVVDGLAKAAQADKTVFGAHQHMGIGVAVDRDGHPHWVILLASPLEADERAANSSR